MHPDAAVCSVASVPGECPHSRGTLRIARAYSSVVVGFSVGFAILFTLIALARVAMIWREDLQRGLLQIFDRTPPGAPLVPSPPIDVAGRSFVARVERDGTAVWERAAAGAPACVTPEQRALATKTSEALDDVLLDAALRLLRSHAAWLDRRRTTAGALAAELEVRMLRIHADARDATILAYHPAFSGHLVEIAVGRSGIVRYVGLLG